eukprot:1734093-Rhodomonas_salina.4
MPSIVLRARYVMPGSDIGCAVFRRGVVFKDVDVDGSEPAMVLCFHYGMSGTDIGHGDRRRERSHAHACRGGCHRGIFLRACYAMSSTDTVSGAVCPMLCPFIRLKDFGMDDAVANRQQRAMMKHKVIPPKP